jgi:hypothetical protein
MRTREKLEGHAWLYTLKGDSPIGHPVPVEGLSAAFAVNVQWLLHDAKLVLIWQQEGEGHGLKCLPTGLTQGRLGVHFAAEYAGGQLAPIARQAVQDYLACASGDASPVLRGSRWVRWVR